MSQPGKGNEYGQQDDDGRQERLIPKDDLQAHRATLNHIHVHAYGRRNHAHGCGQDDNHSEPDRIITQCCNHNGIKMGMVR